MRRAALLTVVALLVGCAGGKSVPTAAPSKGSTTTTALTIQIPRTVTTSGTGNRRSQFVSASTASIVIGYIGDNSLNPPPAIVTALPSGAVVASTVNISVSGTTPPPAGQCNVVGANLSCTIVLTLPVGNLDIYVLTYPSPNGAGTLLASSVTIAQVNTNGTVTQPGTSTTASLNSPTANINTSGASVKLPSALALTPNTSTGSLPNPSTSPVAGFTQPAPYSLSAKQTPTYFAADGTQVSTSQTITPLTVTDTDTTGNTCLMYVPTGATTATPCPIGQAGSAVTLSNTSDSYVVLYNNKFIPGAGVTLTARFSTSSTLLSTTQAITVTPAVVAAATALGTASNGGILYDPTTTNVFTGLQSATTPLSATSWSNSSGYTTPQKITITSVNGSTGTTTLTGTGVIGVTIGPDKNIWMTENSAAGTTLYVAANLVNANGISPTTGNATVTAGKGVFAEYTLTASGSTKLNGIANYGGYIWVTDGLNDLWRIDPTTAKVYPNLGTTYTVNTSATAASPVTTSGGSALAGGTAFASNIVVIGSTLYVADSGNNKMVAIAADSNASPSNKCTGGANPCLGTASITASTFVTGSPSTFSLATDGTNVYVQAGTALAQISTALGVTLGLPTFAGATGGLAQGPDGYFFTQATTGAAYGASVTNSTAGATSSLTLCNSTGILAGANGATLGPDNTVLTAPAGSGLTTTAAFCGVIY